MKGGTRALDDRVSPELREYVFRRDDGCVVALFATRGDIRSIDNCRARDGSDLGGWAVRVLVADRDRVLTIAHVRDRAGGRIGHRPPSTPRRTAAVCAGHHLLDPVIDRADVREVADAYLEKLEGPDVDTSRPWETIRRVRARGVSSDASDGRRGNGSR